VAAVIDSRAQLRLAPKGISLLVDVDGGQQRSGVPFAQAPALVREILHDGHVWGGIQCYLGHLQADRNRAEAHGAACDRLKQLLVELARENLVPEVVTGGGTGTAPLDLASGVFTELQAGSYAFMDAIYSEAGAEFEPALFLAATVVSLHHKHHISLDSGLKSLAVEAPPRFISGVPDGTSFRFQGDEHGAAVHMGEVEWPAEGSLVWLQPGHVDPTVNLHDALWVADEDGRLERWAIDARRVTPAA
jgi:D-serine deaminase-like pyridoxal phosphate-dependent protein